MTNTVTKLKNHRNNPIPIESIRTHDGTHDYFIPPNEIRRYYIPEERAKQIKELNRERLTKQQTNAHKILERIKAWGE